MNDIISAVQLSEPKIRISSTYTAIIILFSPLKIHAKQILDVFSNYFKKYENILVDMDGERNIDELTEKDDFINNIASLLNTNGNKVYGNAFLIKTHVPSLSKSILITNTIINNIKEILDNRVKTNIVIYDGEWSNKIVIGNLDDFAKSFFDEEFKKFETPFLLHNINIWYELCDGFSTKICGKILERPIYKCFWFTMITDEYRGSIYLNEVTKIIEISNKIDFPFNAKKEWIDDEKDEFSRKVIKNKYKILDLAYHELC